MARYRGLTLSYRQRSPVADGADPVHPDAYAWIEQVALDLRTGRATITVAVYHDEESAAAGRPLERLSFGAGRAGLPELGTVIGQVREPFDKIAAALYELLPTLPALAGATLLEAET